MGGLEERAGSWPYPAHRSQQLIRDSNQAEIFSHQLITNSNKVPAPGRGCFSPAGDNDSSLLEPLVTNLLQHAVHSSRRAVGWRRRRTEQRKRWKERPLLQRTGRRECLVLWGSQAHTLIGTYDLLGPALCEVHSSSSCAWMQAAA